MSTILVYWMLAILECAIVVIMAAIVCNIRLRRQEVAHAAMVLEFMKDITPAAPSAHRGHRLALVWPPGDPVANTDNELLDAVLSQRSAWGSDEVGKARSGTASRKTITTVNRAVPCALIKKSAGVVDT